MSPPAARSACRWARSGPGTHFGALAPRAIQSALAACLATGIPVGSAGLLAAQEGCAFVEGSGNLQTVDLGGNPVTYVSTPNLVCRDGVRIRSDSAVAYQASNYVQLIGRVRFEDPVRRLTATRAEYFTTVGRLQAHGSVELEQKEDGGLIRGDELIYHRAGPDRPLDQLDVYGGRPTARLYLRPREDTLTIEPLPSPSDTSVVPYDVEADRIVIEGESYFQANGRAEVLRGDMSAFADSIEYDQVGGTLRLAERASMVMDGRELSAQVIRAILPDDVVREVIARRQAVLTDRDVRLEAPVIHVFFDAGTMERLVAIPIPADPLDPGMGLSSPPREVADSARPVARAQGFVVVADSLDVATPSEVLERIQAFGAARAESSARDSLNTPDIPEIARTDWIEGDTIVARFVRVESAPSGESASDTAEAGVPREYRLEQLSAVGSARSLYRMVPSDSTGAVGDRRPAIHYVTAAEILIDWVGGEIDHMRVTGQTEGVHVEPTPRATPDSTAAPDSALIPDRVADPDVTDPEVTDPDGANPDSVGLTIGRVLDPWGGRTPDRRAARGEDARPEGGVRRPAESIRGRRRSRLPSAIGSRSRRSHRTVES